jgi:hypothetical protein
MGLNKKTMRESNIRFVCTKNVHIGDGIIILKGDVVLLDSLELDSIEVVVKETILYPEMELSINPDMFVDHFELIRN